MSRAGESRLVWPWWCAAFPCARLGSGWLFRTPDPAILLLWAPGPDPEIERWILRERAR